MLKDKRFWIGMVVSVVCLWAAMRNVDWAKVGGILAGARYGWLAAALVVYLGGYWGRCGRVSQILAPIKKVAPARVLPPLMTGFMFNNILPGRLGEVVLAFMLGKREGISKTAAFGSVVLSRIFDGFTILCFFLFGLMAFLPLSQGADMAEKLNLGVVTLTRHELLGKIYLAGILGALIFGAIFAGCFFLIVWRDATLKVMEKALFWMPDRITQKGLAAVEKFIGGMEILRSPRKLLVLFLYNFIPWSFEAATYYLVARTVGLDLSLRQVCLVMGMANLALLVPAAPGGIGLFEFAGVMVLVLSGLADASLALAFMLLVHLLILLPINLLGAFFMVREGLSFKAALAQSKES